MTVIMIIFSILMIICGVYCIITPIQTFTALGWIAGIAVVVSGLSAVFRYASGRSGRSIWELIGGIVGILFGIFLTVNSFAQFAANIVIAYAAALWLIIYGISGIAEAVTMKRINKEIPEEFRTASWLVVMTLGVLTAVIGVLCVFQPKITFFSVGLLIGVSILISGIKTLILAIQIARAK